MNNPSVSALRIDAVRELQRVEQEGSFVGLSRNKTFGLEHERRLTDIVSGVTRLRRKLDFIIDTFYRSKSSSMESRVRIILRIGIYELLETGTPAHAAINECVKTAHSMVGHRVTGLVNAVLRTVDRSRDSLVRPTTGDDADDLAVWYSHPTWMVRRWLKRYGQTDTVKLLIHNNSRPVFGIRVRVGSVKSLVSRFATMGVDATESEYLNSFIRVDRMREIIRSGLVGLGSVLVQDEGAGLVVELLDPSPGQKILDACAAPGGKTFAIADRVTLTGRVDAMDAHAGRLSRLQKMAATLRLENVHAIHADLRTYEGTARYDSVLLDVPCSGLGVLAKRSDMRWKRTEKDIENLTKLQDSLLDAAVGKVKRGGLLVYSTCTLEPEENEHRIDAFLKRQSSFRLEPAVSGIPGSMIDGRGMYSSLPFRDGIDGAFAARLRKTV